MLQDLFGFPDLSTALIVLVGFFAAGLAKGTFGVGMPFFGMPVMTLAIPFQTSLAMFAVPNFTANFQQMLMGGSVVKNFKRFAGLLAPMLATIPFSVQFLVKVDQNTCLLVFGVLSAVFAGVQMFPVKFTITPAQEKWLSPLMGLMAGALAGVSGLYGPVLIVYLIALRLPKDDFVAVLSMMYFLGSVALYLALAVTNVLTLQVLAASAVGAVVIGVMVHYGQYVRKRIDDAKYRKLILLLLIGIGLEMTWRALS
ncbi:MAG: sulfite exporter TauE/SafE family protein [Rhodospirillaceae bacterium]|nr:sulfite exporter TauE/SafE family protein [Rhodospirillaceae bacterium]